MRISYIMKIAIFSDSHDHVSNLGKSVDWVEKEEAEMIVHCGDVCRPEVWKQTLKNFSGDFKLCLGNADKGFSWEKEIEKNKHWQQRVFQDWSAGRNNGFNFAFTHFKTKAVELAALNKFDFIFYGHTHKPWKERAGESYLINPGNIAGFGYPSTFAFWDTKAQTLELKILKAL